MRASLFHVTSLVLLGLGLAGCSKPQPPPTDEPPEPQATAATHTELRDAIQEPIDKAKAVEDTVQEAADQQQAAIDAATN